MKKFLTKILSCALCLCLLGSVLTGCKEGKWTATSLKGWGSTENIVNGGFITETENYFYYLNGVANSSADNTYGKPVKGTLMVAKKDLSQTEIAVPKLFAASDFDAGIYIYGNHVYYGTPSTDKNSSGNVAKSEMMFRRAKLDGSSDELLFTVSALSYEYRISATADGKVYVVYYDSSAKAIKSYSVSDKSTVTVALTDEKAKGNESLANYYFLDNAMLGTATVVYTTTVYNLPYNEEMNNATESTRPTERYNRVYTYTAGDKKIDGEELYGKCVYDGATEGDNYSILFADKNAVYVQKTDELGKVTVNSVTPTQLVAGEAGKIVVKDYAVSGNVIDGEDVYILDKGESSEDSESTAPVKVYKDKLSGKDNNGIIVPETRQLVAMCDTISSLLFKVGDYLYYYNTTNQIARINVVEDIENAVEQRVSEDTVSTTWYKPEVITVGSGATAKTCLFYCDNSTKGLSYIKYVDLAGEVKAGDTDDDKENDLFYLDGAKFLGKVLDEDKADIFESKVSALSSDLENGCLVFEKDDDGNFVLDNGKLKVVTAVSDVRNAYNDLANSVKDKVSSSVVDKLKNYERAIEIANLLVKLEGIEQYNKESEVPTALKDAYNAIKTEMEKYYDSGEYKTIGSFIENDLKANYSKACDIFDPETEE